MDNNIFLTPIILFGFSQQPFNQQLNYGIPNIALPINTMTSRLPFFDEAENNILKYTIPIGSSHQFAINRKLTFLSFLKQDWNGDGADVPTEQTFFNAKRFVERLPDDILNTLKEEDINLTPYGTIVLDFENDNKDVISIEVGKDKIGFFTDFNSGDNLKSSGEKIGVNEVPKAILPAFENFLS